VKNRDKHIWKEGEGKEKYWKTERKKHKIEEENRRERTKQK
jgi:hypothetical protein